MAAACGLAQNPWAVPQGGEIVVGAPLAATGPTGREGALTRQGYDLWLDWANRNGGIEIQGVRHHVRILYGDDRGQADLTNQLALRMVTQGTARFLLGPLGMTSGAAVATVANEHRVPMVVSSGAARPILTAGNRYAFGVVASADEYPQSVISMALTMRPAPTTIGIISADDTYSQAVEKGTAVFAASKGLRVVIDKSYPSNSTDLHQLVQQVKDVNPDIFVDAGQILGAIAAHKAAMDLQLNPKVYAYAAGPDMPTFIAALGKGADYTVIATPWTPQAKYEASYYLSSAQYVQAYQKKFNTRQPPNFMVAGATAAGVALQAAIENAQSVDPERVRDALASLDVNTFYGRIKFDAQGQNTYKPILVEQIKGGKRLTVWPQEMANAAPTWPTPTWEARLGSPPRVPDAKLPSTGDSSSQ
jgi:branched-chain amino acid transport system substrate-binding protein